jgi:hypothetical protein
MVSVRARPGRRGDPLQPAQVPVHGEGLPASVGEDRRVEAGDLAAGGEQQHGGASDASASLAFSRLL